MSIDNQPFRRALVAVFACVTLMGGHQLQAQSRGDAPGYLTDSEGNIVRSGADDCMHTGSWSSDKANIVGCDGVILQAKVDKNEGAPSGLVAEMVFPAATLFAFDSAEFTEAGKQAIDEYRSELRPELTDAYAAVIVGHTDSTGNPEYNMKQAL